MLRADIVVSKFRGLTLRLVEKWFQQFDGVPPYDGLIAIGQCNGDVLVVTHFGVLDLVRNRKLRCPFVDLPIQATNEVKPVAFNLFERH